MEEILKRHRKEVKDLQNRITGMKKQATKSTRKEVMSKCNSLQEDLALRHKQELESVGNIESNDGNSNDVEVTPEELLKQLELGEENPSQKVEPQTQQQQPKKRRNRQKEKLAKRQLEIEKMKEEARQEAAKQPNLQKIEDDAINQLCELNNVKPFDIKPDGHCLFASVLDQLKIRHSIDEAEYDVYKLRSLACQYIRAHSDDFIPYLFDETTMQLKDIDEYTKQIETTAAWGGEIELLALAKVFDCPISVLMSGRAKHLVNEESNQPELKLVYYKHSYALGEHYNSLHDI